MTARKKGVFTGIVIMTAAFIVLAFTDRYGTNWASVVSPLLFVISWIVIGGSLLSG